MSRYDTAERLRQAQAERFERVRRSLKVAHRELADEMKATAIELTSGTMPESEIERLHPWARSAHVPQGKRSYRTSFLVSAPRLPINAHTHRLQNSIRLIPNADGYTLQFTAPYSQFILAPGGTKTMVARGFWPEMRKVYARKRTKLQKAYEAASHA